MLTFRLDGTMLSRQERSGFAACLDACGLEPTVWGVFDALFRSATPRTKPVVLRVFEDGQLCAAAIVVRCTAYGRAMFDHRAAAGAVNLPRVPLYLWIRVGCGMDMLSNPGFVVDPRRTDELITAMVGYLQRHTLLTVIYDATDHASLYGDAAMLPAVPRALVDTSGLRDVDDYLQSFNNFGRKQRKFANKGGALEIVPRQLSSADTAAVKRCFLSTAEHSALALPYQDLYLRAALTTSATELDDVYYFVARSNGALVGYQAAVKTGSYLNGMHGAFDRTRHTTYHAYDLLFAELVGFAVQHDLDTVDFGAVINETKQRMINTTVDMSYYVQSRSTAIKRAVSQLIRRSKLQAAEQLRFRNADAREPTPRAAVDWET